MEGGGGNLSELYSSSKRLSLKIRDALERLERLEFTSTSSSSLSSSSAVVPGSSDDQAALIRRDINQIQSLCADMDRLWRSIPSKPQRDLWKRKVEQVSEEAESFRASLDKYTSRHQKRIQEAQERAELLGRASGDTVLRIFDEESQAMESVRRSSRLLEESFATGVAILSKYGEQRDHLKVLNEWKRREDEDGSMRLEQRSKRLERGSARRPRETPTAAQPARENPLCTPTVARHARPWTRSFDICHARARRPRERARKMVRASAPDPRARSSEILLGARCAARSRVLRGRTLCECFA